MSDNEERIPLTFTEIYRRARAAGSGSVPPFDLQRGLDDLRAWIDREVDLVEEPGRDLASAAARSSQAEIRGRRDLLEELVALARQPEDGPAVLVGMGGAGKSTLAAALAEQVRSWDRQVWWVSAADLAGFSAGLTSVVRDLGGSRTDVDSIAKGAADGPDRLWRLLEGSPRKWLLVIDNADDPWTLAAADSPAGVQDGAGWARASRRGLVVVTSRESDQRMWTGAQLFTVGQLGMADAARVLRDLAPEAGDETDARALARRLGGLPLALHLAGRYLRSGVAQWPTFAAYDQALGSLEGSMVDRTAELSLDGLARHGIPQARELMRLASCYAPESIPTRILPMTGLREALDGLRGVGLIQESPASITLHPVVTDANRAHLEGPEVWHSAIAHLVGALGELSFGRPEHWPQYRLLGQHLLAMLDTAADRVDQDHLALLMDVAATTARALIHSGAGRAAGTLCQIALARGAALGEEHRAVLRVRHQLAWAVADAGGLARAEAIYQDVLGVRRRVLGDLDPDTLDSRHEFGWIAGRLGRWAEAEQRYRDTLRDRLIHTAPDARDTLTTRHELAYAIAQQGRFGEARQAFEDVLRDRQRVLPDRAPQTLQTQHAIAWITAKQGSWAEAEGLYRNLLDLRQVLEADHPHVLLTLHELAWTIARQGRRAEAESIYRRVLERRSRTLGDDHPDTETTRWALSELRQGRIVDAVHPA
ncbi:tetratricopeptide repeat protein [Micromonospora peucetia]|uniref:Tetratricopeptide repeat protein n=1 Tax=Micromonospora peucetia TaxID=47871 RepID=A0A1C6UC18_9ACTN|nr:tetratricopeptide repeat protein [Micromonospora peucetia]MCX4386467.1 tetratricopeptide repeat protein [Micromonospora peucetia]WSA33802.1 tetratricopeptide repeat protein [Micromonospora peucetia]SCL51572.1 Tetratricopeptide repeat-containing protein [Micromonospora peucetia]